MTRSVQAFERTKGRDLREQHTSSGQRFCPECPLATERWCGLHCRKSITRSCVVFDADVTCSTRKGLPDAPLRATSFIIRRALSHIFDNTERTFRLWPKIGMPSEFAGRQRVPLSETSDGLLPPAFRISVTPKVLTMCRLCDQLFRLLQVRNARTPAPMRTQAAGSGVSRLVTFSSPIMKFA